MAPKKRTSLRLRSSGKKPSTSIDPVHLDIAASSSSSESEKTPVTPTSSPSSRSVTLSSTPSPPSGSKRKISTPELQTLETLSELVSKKAKVEDKGKALVLDSSGVKLYRGDTHKKRQILKSIRTENSILVYGHLLSYFLIMNKVPMISNIESHTTDVLNARYLKLLGYELFDGDWVIKTTSKKDTPKSAPPPTDSNPPLSFEEKLDLLVQTVLDRLDTIEQKLDALFDAYKKGENLDKGDNKLDRSEKGEDKMEKLEKPDKSAKAKETEKKKKPGKA